MSEPNSSSKAIQAFLSSKEPGYTFTSLSIFEELQPTYPDLTFGGVTGFIAKVCEVEAAIRTGKTNRCINYVLKDPGIIKDLRTKASSRGGAEGRSFKKHPHPHTVEVPEISARITAIADELLQLSEVVDLMRPNLGLVKTEDLLRELMRRQETLK